MQWLRSWRLLRRATLALCHPSTIRANTTYLKGHDSQRLLKRTIVAICHPSTLRGNTTELKDHHSQANRIFNDGVGLVDHLPQVLVGKKGNLKPAPYCTHMYGLIIHGRCFLIIKGLKANIGVKEGMELMQEKTTKRIENIFIKHEQSERRLENCETELRAREAVNDTKKGSLTLRRKSGVKCFVYGFSQNQLVIMEQTKADERMLKLAEDQKRQKELHDQIIELQKQLDDRQRLELEIKQMKGALKVMEHMTNSKKKKDLIQKDLKEKEDARVHFHRRIPSGSNPSEEVSLAGLTHQRVASV
ncbi:hypothetical protein Tco_0568647 [Tanacetum coccineum]